MDEPLKYEISDYIMYVHNITPENIHELKIPEEVTDLRIYGDYLDHFNIPNGLETVHINSMGLKTLIISESLDCLHCSYNFLRTLKIPARLTVLEARGNLLSNLKVTGCNLEIVDIRSNKLTSLDFAISPKVQYFNAAFNNVSYVSPEIQAVIDSQDIQISPRAKTPDDEDCKYRIIRFNSI
jgi:hypothetical protein